MPNPDPTTRTAASDSNTARPAGKTPPPEPTRSTSSLAVTQTVVAPASASLARVQWIVAGVMVAIAIFAACRLWMIEGLARVARIEGPSMAPAFLGGHYRVTCEDCRFVFRCNAEQVPAGGEASCPNCGYPTNALREEDLVAGEKVIIDHWPVAVRGPRIGEVVAAGDPDEPGELVIKRVAAGPGQQLAIRGGELFLDGDLVRKSWRELAQVRILVHDNSYQPTKTTGMPDRWQNADDGTAWHPALTGYHCQPTDAKKFEWLEYTHHQMFGWHSRTRQSPVLDLDSYNPSQTRLLNTVPDVLLSCRLRVWSPGQGQFALAAIDGEQRFEAIVDPAKQTTVLMLVDQEGTREVAREDRLMPEFGNRGVAIEFGLCDQQVILRVAGRQFFCHEYKRSGKRDIYHPLALGSQGLELTVDELRVWRDIYYLAPDGTPRDWESKVPPRSGTLALLGDNQSVSTDSRHWESGIPPQSVRGVVIRPFWATR